LVVIGAVAGSLAGVLGGCSSHAPPTDNTTLTTQPTTAAAQSKSEKNGSEQAGTGVLGFFAGIGDQIGTFFEKLGGNTPLYYAKLTQSGNPDLRRMGINGLVKEEAGRTPTYTTLYRQMAEGDPDYLVRAQALRALNQCRDKDSTDVFIKALQDPHVPVRLEGAKALNRVPAPEAAGPLLAVLNKPDENRDVRIAAAEALQHYKTLDVGRSLVRLLGDRDFGLAFQSRKTLKRLTGRDLLYDEAAWLAYLTGPDKPFG
jgi:hypothetical protein